MLSVGEATCTAPTCTAPLAAADDGVTAVSLLSAGTSVVWASPPRLEIGEELVSPTSLTL